jgi:hypothetical protein
MNLVFLFGNQQAMKQHLNTIILSLAIIIGVWILASNYRNRNRSNDLIMVTGSASKDFTSDLISWTAEFSASGKEMQLASAQLKESQSKVSAFLLGKGISEKEIVFSAIAVEKEEVWVSDGNDRGHYEFKGYLLKQGVTIQSREVSKVERVSREITDLIFQGLQITSNQPEYYYTQLADLKIEMVAAATADAKVRAQQIAENSGADLGHLRYASMGVFQITAQNSSDDYEWGGSFNTSSREKTASIVMRLQFGID